MAFVALTNKNPGDPVLADDFNDIKSNFDDHESRMSSLETTFSSVEMYVGEFTGPFETGLKFFPSPVSRNFTAVNASFTIDLVGSATGILEFDIKKTSGTLDPSGAVSIFTTKPSINYSTASDGDTSTNFVLDVTTKNFTAGDFFYFEITQAPTGPVELVVLNFYGEV